MGDYCNQTNLVVLVRDRAKATKSCTTASRSSKSITSLGVCTCTGRESQPIRWALPRGQFESNGHPYPLDGGRLLFEWECLLSPHNQPAGQRPPDECSAHG